MAKAGSAEEWQAKAAKAASESVNAIQSRIEENLKLLENSSRTSIDLLKKAMDTTKATTVAGGQAKLQELWEASLEAMRANAGAIRQANARWVETCMQFVPKATAAA
jgi:phage-related minor tail protein